MQRAVKHLRNEKTCKSANDLSGDKRKEAGGSYPCKRIALLDRAIVTAGFANDVEAVNQ